MVLIVVITDRLQCVVLLLDRFSLTLTEMLGVWVPGAFVARSAVDVLCLCFMICRVAGATECNARRKGKDGR